MDRREHEAAGSPRDGDISVIERRRASSAALDQQGRAISCGETILKLPIRSRSGDNVLQLTPQPAPGGVYTGARIRIAAMTLLANRREIMGSSRPRLFRALLLASGIFCLLYLIALVLTPLMRQVIVRVEMPERSRTVILEEPIPEAPSPPLETEKVALEQVNAPQVFTPPVEEVEPVAPPHRREPPRELDPDAARLGRARAQEATAKLASVTEALDRSLNDLSSSLQASSTGSADLARRRRERSVRSGRSEDQLPAAGTGPAGSGAAADLKGSAVQGSLVAIGSLAPARVQESHPTEEAAGKSVAGPGVYRSNASLLAVIQKYAAGIRYCYDSELKREPSLQGKLVVAMTVAAAGDVVEATMVQNTTGSNRLAACALSQIRDWKFPTISGGLTTFQAPFVFTPPN